MTAPTHRIGGLAAGATLMVFLRAEFMENGMLILGALFGSLFPDIDNRNSSISHRLSIMSAFVYLGQKVIRGIAWIFPKEQEDYIRSLIGHRGLTHSLAAMLLFPLCIHIIAIDLGIADVGNYFAIGVFGGILSHLILDMFAGGVPLYIPFSTQRITLMNIKTGGIMEWVFRVLLLIILIYFGMEALLWQGL